MANLSLAVERNLLPEFEQLRRIGFHDKTGTRPSSDAFDEHSLHVVARFGSRVVGLVRLTRQPPSVLAEWALDALPLPSGSQVVEFTRAVVDPAFRGKSIYKLLMLRVIAAAAELPGATTGTGAVESQSPLLPFLHDIGFISVEPFIRFLDPPVEEPRLCRCLMCDLRTASLQSEHIRRAVLDATSEVWVSRDSVGEIDA